MVEDTNSQPASTEPVVVSADIPAISNTFLTLVTEDWKKVGKGAVIAVIGALLTYGTTFVTTYSFGNYTPLVVAVWSVLVNLGWKCIKSNQN